MLLTLPLIFAFYNSSCIRDISPVRCQAKAKAFRNMRSPPRRWEELKVYTADGKLNIDNNPVENSIRPVAVGRKNYLFAGSHEAAKRSAMLYSLLGTCKLHSVNPMVWLTDVLNRINSHPINQIQDLLPHQWQPLI